MIWRISLFYLGSIFVVVALVAVERHGPGRSDSGSYQSALDQIGLGSLDHRCSTS